MFLKNNKFFLIAVVFFYFIFPLSFFSKHEFSNNIVHTIYNKETIIFSILFFIIYLVFYFQTVKLYLGEFSTKLKDVESFTKLFCKLILIFCLFFILKDIFEILSFWIRAEFLNVNNRSNIYELYLNKRQTYIKISIILSLYLYRYEKYFSIFSIISIIILDIISLSRFYSVIIVILFFLNYFKFTKKNNFYFLTIFIFLILFRAVYSALGSNEIFHESKGLLFYFNYLKDYATGEFFVVFATLLLFINNLVTIFRLFLEHESFLKLLIFYFENNIYFLLQDFFYLKKFSTFNYWDSFLLKNNWANHGFTYLVSYLPLLFIYLFILKKIINIYNKLELDNYLVNISLSYLIASSFRGNVIHEFGFVVKLLLIFMISKIIYKFIKNVNYKKQFF